MPVIKDPEQIRRLQALQRRLNIAEQELLMLEKGMLGKGIFDPVLIKKKELLMRLRKITSELFEDIPGEDPILRERIIDNIRIIIPFIPTLTKGSEKELKIKKSTLNNDIKKLNAVREAHKRITTLHYGRDLFTVMDILATAARGIMTIVWAWNTGISAAAQRTGLIFYPINASFLAVAALFNFLARGVELFKTKRAASETDAIRAEEKKDAAALLKASAVFRFFVFALQVASALAFAGVLSTPLGWAFVAGATLFTWIDEMRTEIKTADANLRKFQAEHAEDNPLSEQNEITEKKLIELASKARYDAAWKFFDVIAMVLIACGPIPPAGPLLGMIGLGMLAIVPAKKVITGVYEKYFKKHSLEVEFERLSTKNPDEPFTSAMLQTSLDNNNKNKSKSKSSRKRLLSTRKRIPLTPQQITPVDELIRKPPTTRERFIGFLFSKKPRPLADNQPEQRPTSQKKSGITSNKSG